MSPAALDIAGLAKRFDRPAVEGLTLRVPAGEFFTLLGPNGAGKTTTLRMVAGLLPPDRGSIATDVAVMYAGALVEQAPKHVLYAAPKHPYTQALLEAVPRPDPDRTRAAALGGEVPSILNPPPGCAFSARCPRVMDVCRSERPAPRRTDEAHVVACHLYDEAA